MTFALIGYTLSSSFLSSNRPPSILLPQNCLRVSNPKFSFFLLRNKFLEMRSSSRDVLASLVPNYLLGTAHSLLQQSKFSFILSWTVFCWQFHLHKPLSLGVEVCTRNIDLHQLELWTVTRSNGHDGFQSFQRVSSRIQVWSVTSFELSGNNS